MRRQRDEVTHVWVRTDVVEAIHQNGGHSLPPKWNNNNTYNNTRTMIKNNNNNKSKINSNIGSSNSSFGKYRPSSSSSSFNNNSNGNENDNNPYAWGWARAHVVQSSSPTTTPLKSSLSSSLSSPPTKSSQRCFKSNNNNDNDENNNNNCSPFGQQIKLRKVIGSPLSREKNQQQQQQQQRNNTNSSSSSPFDNNPLTITIDDYEFAPSHLHNVTVTIPPSKDYMSENKSNVNDQNHSSSSSQPFVHMANSWWQEEQSRDYDSNIDNNDESNMPPDDLTSLTHLHEPAVVFCLKKRYEHDRIYTYTGKILIALNPFRVCENLYGEDVMKQYWRSSNGNNNDIQRPKPHIYAIAQDAYGSMMRGMEQRQQRQHNSRNNQAITFNDQSILVSGESGAGKTVTTKIVMGYLATLSQQQQSRRNNNSSDTISSPRSKARSNIESQVLQSNPILESFGNARTIRNDNSSRFGKFIEIQFSSSGCLLCASIETYLLEKVRLITQTVGERNYHIFYELLSSSSSSSSSSLSSSGRRGRIRGGQKQQQSEAGGGGPSSKEKAMLEITNKTPHDFKMTSVSNTYDRRDGILDCNTYKELRTALDTVGFTKDEQMELFTITTALLHASNLSFVSNCDSSHGGDASAIDMTNPSLKSTASLLGVSETALNNALCTCAIEAAGETLIKNMSTTQANKALEALIKAIYNALFTYIVRRINNSIFGGEEELDINDTNKASIGVLDIFGFESFATNSFEQLCINYCNEALQQQFNKFVFKLEQEEYKSEGIEWSFIKFPDNQDVLDLIELKRVGILSILDESCRISRSTDRSFARSVYDQCSSHDRFVANKTQQASFTFSINHYAGYVEYDTTNFLEKNKDELSKETTDLLMSSSHPLLPTLGTILKDPPRATANSAGNNRNLKRMTSSLVRESVGSQFSTQLRELRSRIQQTTPHYVRCLKPNDDLVPNNFNPLIIADQLRCAGVLEAIRVSRVGFPQRYAHDAFVQRYRVLEPKEMNRLSRRQCTTGSELCDHLVKSLGPQLADFFQLKTNSEEDNGNIAERSPHGQSRNFYDPVTVGIQMGRTKVFLRRRAFDCLELLRSRKVNAAATVIQSTIRMHLDRTSYEISRWATITLQTFVRRLKAIRVVRGLRNVRSVTMIQCAWRRYVARRYFLAATYLVIRCQSLHRGAMIREVYAFLSEERKAILIQSHWRRYLATKRFFVVYTIAISIQTLYRAKRARIVLKQLKLEAKDLSLVAAERDRLKEEAAILRRELEEARRKADLPNTWHADDTTSQVTADSEEVQRLRRELERLQNAQVRSPSTELAPSSEEAMDRVEQLLAQKDQELERLREEVVSIRANQSPQPLSRLSSALSPLRWMKSGMTGSASKGRSDDSCAMSVTSGISLLDTDDLVEEENRSTLFGSPMRSHVENSSSLIGSWSGANTIAVTKARNQVERDSKEREFLLHRAASDGDLDLLQKVLASCSNISDEINEGDHDGRSPLHLASLSSNLEIAKVLLENDAVANTQDHYGNTALHLATDPDMTRLLILTGSASPIMPDVNGVCALHLAVRRRDCKSVRIILSCGPNVNTADDVDWFTPLHLVAQFEENVDDTTIPNRFHDKQKPRRLQIAEMLCGVTEPSKPDLNYQDSQGNSPLHHAAALPTTEATALFKIFLGSGSNPRVSNDMEQTPLHVLCHNEELRKLGSTPELVGLMLRYGADPNQTSSTGCSPLHLCLYHGDIESAIQLVENGAELHVTWTKPKSWPSFWNDDGSPQVLPLDMVEDDDTLHRILSSLKRAPDMSAPSSCSRCMHCKIRFGAFQRSLHCQRCRRLVCGSCSSQRHLKPEFFPTSLEINEPLWFCTICENILSYPKEDDCSRSTQPPTSLDEYD